jgi:hypothetical protein
MRVMIKVSIPVEKGDQAIANGSLPKTMQEIRGSVLRGF